MDFEKITEGLNAEGISVFPGFFSSQEVATLSQNALTLWKENIFKIAAVGKGQEHQVDLETRRDLIFWFDQSELSPAQDLLWSRLKILQGFLNEKLFLGLWDLEGHYSIYPPGAFYQKHLDAF